MILGESGFGSLSLPTKHLLFAAIGLLVLDVTLFFTLNPWLEMLVLGQFSVALLLGVVGLVRLFLRKGPTVIQLIVWLCFAAGLPFGILREQFLLERIETIGTVQLLQDARELSAELSQPGQETEEFLDGENLLVPESFKALNPAFVKVRTDSVAIGVSISLGSEKTLVLMTDPTIVPGSVNPSKTFRSWEEGDRFYSEQWIAPGVRFVSWRS